MECLEAEYKNIDLKRVTEHYEKQEIMLNNFYDELIGLVDKMRNDHLTDLQA